MHTGGTSGNQAFPYGNPEFWLPWEGGEVWRHQTCTPQRGPFLIHCHDLWPHRDI